MSNANALRKLAAVAEDGRLTPAEVARYGMEFALSHDEVPLTIFGEDLSPLESIVRCLLERGLRIVDIARLTGRDQRAIGVTARRARQRGGIVLAPSAYVFPVTALQDRRLSPFEHVVSHLRQAYNLRYHEIALLLGKDDRTVWTVNRRADRKLSAVRRRGKGKTL
jgi:hypothetical protein